MKSLKAVIKVTQFGDTITFTRSNVGPTLSGLVSSK